MSYVHCVALCAIETLVLFFILLNERERLDGAITLSRRAGALFLFFILPMMLTAPEFLRELRWIPPAVPIRCLCA